MADCGDTSNDYTCEIISQRRYIILSVSNPTGCASEALLTQRVRVQRENDLTAARIIDDKNCAHSHWLCYCAPIRFPPRCCHTVSVDRGAAFVGRLTSWWDDLMKHFFSILARTKHTVLFDADICPMKWARAPIHIKCLLLCPPRWYGILCCCCRCRL